MDEGDLSAGVQRARGDLRSLDSAAQSLDQRATSFQKNYGALGQGMVVFGAATVGAFGLGVRAGANFDQAMDGVGASLGGVGTAGGITREQLAALDAEALRIGASTSKSASEAAMAMDLMAKAGIDVVTILEGGAQAAVNVSEATGEGLQQSAETVSAMSLLFADAGLSADQMADIVVTGMNNSSATMSEFQTGIARLAPVIASTGMSFQDSAANIAFFNSLGLGAAEVGTSLTSTFNSLTNPTAEAAQGIADLGIQVYDAQGAFVGFPALFDQLSAATAGMTEEQRNLALGQIFTADSLDVVNLALTNGTEGYEAIRAAIDESGSAAVSSAQRMDNLNGDLEQLGGTLETIGISATRGLQPLFRFATQGLADLGGAFLSLPTGVQTAAAALVGLTGAISLAGGGAILAYPKFLQMRHSIEMMRQSSGPAGKAIRGLGFAFRFLQANIIPLLIIMALVTLAVLAFKNNWFGFGDAVRRGAAAAAGALEWVRVTLGYLVESFQFFRAVGANPLEAALLALSDTLRKLGLTGAADFLADLSARFGYVGDVVGGLVDRELAAFAKMFGGVGDALTALFKGDWQGVLKGLRKMLAGFGDELAARFKFVGQILKGLKTGFKPLDKAINTLGKVFEDFGRLIQEIFQLDFAGALVVAQRLLRHLGELATATWNLIVSAWRAIDWGAVWDLLVTAAGAALDLLLDLVVMAALGLVDLFKEIDWDAVWDALKTAAIAALSGLGDLVGEARDALVAGFDAIPWGDLWSGLQDAASAAFSGLKDVAGQAFDIGLDLAVNLGGDALGLVGDAWEWLKSKLPILANLTAEGFSQGVSLALNLAVALGKGLLEWGGKALSWLWSQVPLLGELAGGIVQAVSFAVELHVTLFKNLFDWAGSALSWLWSKVALLGELAAGVTQDVGVKLDIRADMLGDLVGWGGKALSWLWGKIEVLAELAGGVAQDVTVGLTVLADLLSDAFAAFADGISWLKGVSPVVADLADGVSVGVSVAVDVAAGAISVAADFVGKVMDGIGAAAGWTWDAAKGGFNFVSDLVVDVTGQGGGAAAATAPSAPFGPPIPDAAPAVNAAQQLKQADMDIAIAVAGIGASAYSLGSSLDGMSADLEAFTSDVTGVMDGFVGTMGGKGTEAGSHFRSLLGTELTITEGDVQSHLDTISVNTGAWVGNFGPFGTAGGGAFRDKIQPPMNDAARNTSVSMDAIQTRAGELVANMRAMGSLAGSVFRDGISTGMDVAAAAALSGRNRILSALTLPSLYSPGFSVGSSLGEGIAAGISGWVSTIAATAANAVNSAISAARAAAGNPRSPSPVMEAAVGVPLALAIFTPFRVLGPQIERAAALAVSGAVGAASGAVARSGPLPVTGLAPRGLGQDPRSGGTTVNHNYYLTPPEFQKLMRDAEAGATFADQAGPELGRRKGV